MTDLANLRITVDSREAKRSSADLDQLERSGRRAEQSTNALAGASNRLGLALKSIGFGIVAAEVVRMADAYTSMLSKIRLVTDGQGEMAAVTERVFAIAIETRTGLEATTELYARLARAADNLGASQNDVLTVTEAINKATIVSGATAAEAQAGIVQLAQGFASGTLRGDELNSVLEQMPRVAEMIADGMGITVGQLREFGQAGKLTSKEVFDAIKKMSSDVEGEFAQMPMTVGQALTNLRSQVTRFIGQLNEATGFTSGLASTIDFLGRNLANLAAIAGVVAVRLVAVRVAMAAGAVTAYLRQIIALNMALGATSARSALFAGGLKAVQGAFRALTATMAVNPFVAVATAVAAVTALLFAYRDEQFKLGNDTVTVANIFVGAWDYVKQGFEFVQKAFAEGWASALSSVSPALQAMGQAFDKVLGFVGNLVRTVVNRWIGLFAGLGAALAALWRGEDVGAAFQRAFRTDYVGAFSNAVMGTLVHLNNHGASLRTASKEQADLNRATAGYAAPAAAAAEADKERGNELESAVQSMEDYIRGLRLAREEIGLNQIALERLNQSRERAKVAELEALGLSKERADEMRRQIDTEGAALVAAMQADIVKQRQAENAALREQVALFWASAEAQDAARAAREGEAQGLEGQTLADFIAAAVEGGALERAKEELDAVKEKLEELKELTFDIDLEGVFGRWGKALGGLVNVFDDFTKRQEDLAKMLKREDLSQEDRIILQQKALRNEINLYGNLASSVKGFFKEKSAGYKAAQAAETAFRAVEFALSVKATAQKVAEGAAQMFAKLGPLGFAAVGAMLGVMAGLGFMGGGGGGSRPTYNEGRGTVLGDPEAQSESLSRGLELLNENADATLRYTSQMALSLRKIENNIGGLSRMVVSSRGIEASAAGVNTGGGLLKSLFGSTKKIIGQGIFGAEQGLADIIANGMDLQFFTDIKKKSKFFGITTGTSFRTQFADADEGLENQLGRFFGNVVEVVATAGEALGVPLDVIESRLASFVVNLGKVNLKDLSGDEITKALEAALGAEADRIAQTAIPMLEAFQKVGEGYFETLVRVAATVEAFTSAMDGLGNSTDVSLESIMAITDLFGDLAEMTGALEDYFSAFYSEAEKLALLTGRLEGVFADLGFTVPQTIEDYKALVDSLDLNSAAGQEAFVRLIQLAPVFEDILKLQEQVARERQTLEQNLVKAYRREAAELEATIDQFSKFSESLREFRDSLFVGVGSVDTYTQALAELVKVGSLASAGDADAMGRLQSVSQNFLGAARSRAGSLFEYQRAVALVGGYVQGAIDAADEQVSAAQQQLDLLTAQVEELVSLNETVESVDEAIRALLAFNGVSTPSAAVSYNPDAVTTEQQRQSEELAAIRETLDSGLYAVAKNTLGTANILDRWDGDGQPDIREVAGDYY